MYNFSQKELLSNWPNKTTTAQTGIATITADSTGTLQIEGRQRDNNM